MRDEPAAQWADRREAVFIVNPTAHNRPKRGELQQVDAWLQEQGWRTTWQETKAPRSAIGMAARAAENRCPLLFVCGGDGTVSEAANGLAGSETVLGVIPAGTVNLWAREAGLKLKPLKAVQAAVHGERRRIDLGRAGARYFLLMAGYGADAAVTASVSQRAKDRLGATAFALAAAREALRYRGTRVRINADGEEHTYRVLMLVAGNTRKYAGITSITPEARADDGFLDLRIYRGRGTGDILRHALATLLGRHRKSKKVSYRRVKKVTLEWEAAVPVQLDGDACAESPTEITVAPGALCVAVPAGFTSPLFSQPPLA